ncbi:hypothetical protein LTS08_000490 [Lithohypha guttulata]|nr:hypothetical protein LTS08_000490 [Lithohypha guttulata]
MWFPGSSKTSSSLGDAFWTFVRTYSFPTDNWRSIAGRKFEKTRQFSIAEAGFDLDIIETDEEEKVRLAFCQLALGYHSEIQNFWRRL